MKHSKADTAYDKLEIDQDGGSTTDISGGLTQAPQFPFVKVDTYDENEETTAVEAAILL